VQGPGKSWNFLGYDVGGGHNDAGADARICKKIAWILSVYTKKLLADPIVTAVCLYI